MKLALEWLGCATFRLTIDDLVVFLDAYIDRASTAPPVGVRAADIDRADFILVGHSHFDHLSGAEVIARNTGARIVGSNETCHVMRRCAIPREQLLPSQGGERHGLSPDVTVRVFPSLHACLWTGAAGGIGAAHTGHLGLTEDDRRSVMAEHGQHLLRRIHGDAERARIAQEHIASAAVTAGRWLT